MMQIIPVCVQLMTKICAIQTDGYVRRGRSRQYAIKASRLPVSGINRFDVVGGQGAQVVGNAFGQGVQIIAAFE